MAGTSDGVLSTSTEDSTAHRFVCAHLHVNVLGRRAPLDAGVVCPFGGIGRRAALKMRFLTECPFESGQGHHYSLVFSAII